MRGRHAQPLIAQAAALLAVVLLTLAGVRSTVMQAAEAGSPAAAMPMCGPGGSGHGDHAPGKAHHAACDFCAAAAHAPICADAPVLPASQAVAWFAPAPTATLGPRGPPAFRARARDPPALPTA